MWRFHSVLREISCIREILKTDLVSNCVFIDSNLIIFLGTTGRGEGVCMSETYRSAMESIGSDACGLSPWPFSASQYAEGNLHYRNGNGNVSYEFQATLALPFLRKYLLRFTFTYFQSLGSFIQNLLRTSKKRWN